MTRVRLSLAEVERLAVDALLAAGCDAANAGAVARTMTAGERDGTESHGLYRLPGAVKALRGGRVDGRARPRFRRLAPGTARVDAGGGFAPLALEIGLPRLAAMAHAQGVAALAVRNCHHYAALWPEVEALAAEGLVAIACTAAAPMVAPHGTATPVFGTNPIAFAMPAEGSPVVFDMATAAMARGDIGLHRRDGRRVPEGTGLDAEGRPTTDPSAILHGGAQLAFGGHKGSALALMVELLAGPAIGDLTSPEAAETIEEGGPPRGGELIRKRCAEPTLLTSAW